MLLFSFLVYLLLTQIRLVHLCRVVVQLQVLAQQLGSLAKFYQDVHHILDIAQQLDRLVMDQLLIFHQVVVQLLVTVLLLAMLVTEPRLIPQDVLQVLAIALQLDKLVMGQLHHLQLILMDVIQLPVGVQPLVKLVTDQIDLSQFIRLAVRQL